LVSGPDTLRIPAEQRAQPLTDSDQARQQSRTDTVLNAADFLSPELTCVVLYFSSFDGSHDFFLFMLRNNISWIKF
jgi:hypothetical protein